MMETTSVPTGDDMTPPPRKRRRWWVYVLISVGALVVLAGAAFLGLVGYYKSLIKNYTMTEPIPLTQVEGTKQDVEALKVKWMEFYQQVVSGKPSRPFQLPADEINRLLATNPDLKGRVWLHLEDGQARVEFSMPLDKTRKPELKGRYLNGEARLEFKLADDGFPVLQVVSVEANGKSPPGWLASKITHRNFLDNVHNNPHLYELLNRIEDVAITNNAVVITPMNSL